MRALSIRQPYAELILRTCGRSLYEWHLTDVENAERFRKPRGHPQPVWFTPF
jgi:hypothetical protein